MAQLTIYWTETAIRQRNYIFEYWIERNQSTTYAKKLNDKIKERANLLKHNPDLGKKQISKIQEQFLLVITVYFITQVKIK